jgi:hypothetical protein
MIPSAEQLFDIGNELPDPRTIIKPKGGHVHLYQKQVLAESERRSLLLKSRLLMILNTRVRQSE